MADEHTNHITTNGICGYIFHAVLWKFIPLCPTSVFLLPKYLKSLHTLAVTLRVQKAGGCEELAPDSKDSKGQAELQPAGTRRVPGVGDRERIPPLDFLTFLASVLFNVLISCHLEQSFCDKKGSIACHAQNLESHDKDLKSEAEHSALFISSRDSPWIVQSVENRHKINQFLRLQKMNSLLEAILRVKAVIFLVLLLN